MHTRKPFGGLCSRFIGELMNGRKLVVCGSLSLVQCLVIICKSLTKEGCEWSGSKPFHGGLATLLEHLHGVYEW